jgi:predicted RNA binding protein YcfA (HicA-like mRNA interferase family)
MSYYVHNVPGRLRVKTPMVKRNKASAKRVEGLMKQLMGVKSIAVNTATGSIVVYHCPKTISCDAILNTLENEGFFDSSKVISHDRYIHESASKAGQMVGNFLFKSVVENALKTAGLSFVAALI